MKAFILLLIAFYLCQLGYSKTVEMKMIKPANHVSSPLPEKLKDLQEPFSCVFTTRIIRQWLHLNNTKEFFIKQAFKLCNRISSNVRSMPSSAAKMQCQVRVRHFLERIFAYIELGEKPEQICRELTMARKLLPQAKKLSLPDMPTIAPFPGDMNSTICGLCEYLFALIDQELQEPKEFQNLISSFRMQVCNDLPPPENQECLYFANNDLAYLIEAFINLPPRVDCFLFLNVCVGPSGQQHFNILNKIDQLIPDRCVLGSIYGCYNQEFAERCNLLNPRIHRAMLYISKFHVIYFAFNLSEAPALYSSSLAKESILFPFLDERASPG
ncbi:uncharacterized protein TRIADDRAFT_54160 [Trichoplax adhaerens]|uniref:Saposin B-type domain-containing protein n=1 Tax=Trichoplax adhaerens TaxID=10228 RepID=B3RRA0_TRIAD|nr:predicted protein [Trichoplax adhaerens]EDV26840.1 predicted protein [Trichoplax adhaerens]|eukprot:XP_002110836.1 predicted protein [Trichoplax adhaerens]